MSDDRDDDTLLDPERWCALSDRERRDHLAGSLLAALEGAPGLRGTRIEVGTVERPWDLTAVVETDVGDLRTPLWSHARAEIFCDGSIHPANRRQIAPGPEVEAAAARLRARLDVRFTLESRGLEIALEPEPGVRRTWTAERARFRSRTAVTREDVVENADVEDVRDLLAHFYSGPSLRVSDGEGEAWLLPAAVEVEGERVTLCRACRRWSEGAHARCPDCGGPADPVVAARPPRR